MRNNGFTAEQVQEAFYRPKKMYPSRTHPGSWRRVTREVCIVGVMEGSSFLVVAMHVNNPPARAVA